MRFLISGFLICFIPNVISIGTHKLITELTKSNFDDNISKYEYVLLEMYRGDCIGCQKLAPELERLATTLEQEDMPYTFRIMKINCEAEESHCKSLKVGGYPHIQLFHNGKYDQDYYGLPLHDSLLLFVTQEIAQSYRELPSMEKFLKFKNNALPSVVGFFTKSRTDLIGTFKNTARRLANTHRFGYTSAKEVLDKHPEFKGKFVLFRPPRLNSKHEPAFYACDPKVLKGEVSERAVNREWENCITSNTNGLVGYRSPFNSHAFKAPLVSVYWSFDFENNAAECTRKRDVLVKLAKNYPTLNFCIASWADYWRDLRDNFKINYRDLEKDKASQPLVTVMDENRVPYLMEEEYSEENLDRFFTAFTEGKLQKFVLSEPIPKQASSLYVRVVGSTFEKIVMDKSKDVFLLIEDQYQKNSKKALEKRLEEVARRLEKDNILVAIIDRDRNYLPKQFQVNSSPCLYFKKRNEPNSPVKMEVKPLTKDEMIKQIAKISTDELYAFERTGAAKKEAEEFLKSIGESEKLEREGKQVKKEEL